MKFLLDKMETNEGRFLPDWEFDTRLDILREKYKYKKTILRDEHGINSELHTVRISSMKQLQEFIEDFGDITITKDCGYYFDIGCPRIIVSDDILVRDDEPALTDEDIDVYVILANNGVGYFDDEGNFKRYSPE